MQGKVNIYTKMKSKYCKKGVVSCKSMRKLVWPNGLNSYSQTCSNNHLYKTTTCLRRPMLSSPKQISIQSLLYKTTTCLTRPTTTFFVPQMKENLSKRSTTKLYPAKKWDTNKATMDKNKRLSDYIYSIATL